MASYSTNEFKNGLKLMIDGDPCSIIDNEFVKPGKGQAFNRVLAKGQEDAHTGNDGQDKRQQRGSPLHGAGVDGATLLRVDPDAFRELFHECGETIAKFDALVEAIPAKYYLHRRDETLDDFDETLTFAAGVGQKQ